MEIRDMVCDDWSSVSIIYEEGMQTRNATFHSHLPSFEVWDKEHLNNCRMVAVNNGAVVGFVALSKISTRETYNGVCELSVYVKRDCRCQGIGEQLINAIIKKSEQEQIWMLQSVVIDDNIASYKLHEKCGFRVVGFREKIAKDKSGKWHNTFLFERRSQIVL